MTNLIDEIKTKRLEWVNSEYNKMCLAFDTFVNDLYDGSKEFSYYFDSHEDKDVTQLFLNMLKAKGFFIKVLSNRDDEYDFCAILEEGM